MGHGHSHAPGSTADRRPIALALGLVLAFMAVEVVAGVLASSLALLSDAAHMLTDAGALALALVAARLAARPAGGRYTFGTGRAEVLSAQVNGALLLAFGVLIGVDAVRRLSDPDAVDGGVVLAVGAAGAVVNVACAWLLARSERQSLNLEGARQHVLADLYGSVGAMAAGGAVLAFGFDRADPIAALVVCALMLRSSWMLLRDSGRVLLEAAPSGLDPERGGPGHRRAERRGRGPRPAPVGGHLGLPGAVGPPARRLRRRLPRPPARGARHARPSASASST